MEGIFIYAVCSLLDHQFAGVYPLLGCVFDPVDDKSFISC
jgi:hypothetical protein